MQGMHHHLARHWHAYGASRTSPHQHPLPLAPDSAPRTSTKLPEAFSRWCPQVVPPRIRCACCGAWVVLGTLMLELWLRRWSHRHVATFLILHTQSYLAMSSYEVDTFQMCEAAGDMKNGMATNNGHQEHEHLQLTTS